MCMCACVHVYVYKCMCVCACVCVHKVVEFKQPPALKGQYFVRQNVHVVSKLTPLKQSPANQVIFTLYLIAAA